MFLLRPTPNCLLLSGALAGLASLFSLPAQTTLPPGPGADLVYAKCQPCHDMGVVIQSAGIARPMWLGVMAEMKEFGMKVTPDEHEALVGYLATYLGPDPPPVPDNKPTAPVASALDGAKLFDRHCSACHGKDGKGVSEQVPPLAGNPYLFKDSRYTIAVLLHGLQGPIAIKGRTYEGVMPGFEHLDERAEACGKSLLALLYPFGPIPETRAFCHHRRKAGIEVRNARPNREYAVLTRKFAGLVLYHLLYSKVGLERIQSGTA